RVTHGGSIMRKRFSAIVACGALLGLSLIPVAHSAAQSPSKVYRLDAKVDPAIPRAKIAAVEGVSDRNGHRFELDNLTIRQPVLVVLRAMDPTHKVQLRLMKFTWEKAERSGLTDAEGFVSFLVKTEGDFRILVNAAGPDARYSLFALVGDEVIQPVPSIFVPMSRGEHQAPTIQPHMLHVPGPGWLSILFFPGLVLRKYDRHGRTRRTRALLLSVLAIAPALGGAAGGAQKETSGKGPSAIGFADWMGKFIASGDFSKFLDVTANAVDSWNNVDPLT